MQSVINGAIPVQSEQEKQPWERMEGESTLWFNRFQRYLQLGYGRTLDAAWKQERQEIKVLKGTEKPAQSQKARQKHGKSTVKNGLMALPTKPEPTQHPGSWRRASVRWQWVARCAAWDSYQIEQMVERHLATFQAGLSTSIGRVDKLKSMHSHLEDVYNNNVANMSLTEICVMQARLQALLKDIRDEMQGFDQAVARVLLRRQCEKFYTQDMTQAATCNPDELLAQIAEEEARRAAAAIK